MTTLGKILVFLVFIGALAAGGLMVFVSKTTSGWPERVKERDDYIRVLKANAEAEAESRKKWLLEYEKLKQHFDVAMIEAKSIQVKLKRDADDRAKEAIDAGLAQKRSDLLHKQAQAEATRLQQELLFVQGVVKDREEKILALQDEVTKAKVEAQAAKNDRDALARRNLALMDRNVELEKQIYNRDNKQVAGVVNPHDPNYHNPPPLKVQGIIQEIDKTDKKLVKISVGSDAGLKKDHTLEVFRTSPKAEYVGRLLIVDADLHYALGRLMPQPGVQGPVTMVVGDEVAGKLR